MLGGEGLEVVGRGLGYRVSIWDLRHAENVLDVSCNMV